VLVLTIVDNRLWDEKPCAELRNELITAVAETGAKKIVLDMSNVDSVSSVAFRPLLSLRRVVEDARARMVLCGLSELVAEVFRATRLLISGHSSVAPFEARSDLPSAIAALR
jgi:anti-anti-sigma factor